MVTTCAGEQGSGRIEDAALQNSHGLRARGYNCAKCEHEQGRSEFHPWCRKELHSLTPQSLGADPAIVELATQIGHPAARSGTSLLARCFARDANARRATRQSIG